MAGEHPSLDEQMTAAVAAQRAHIAASRTVDRRGWSRAQWLADARNLMGALHGSVQSLMNGHVTAMLGRIGELEKQLTVLRAARELLEVENRRLREGTPPGGWRAT